MQLRKSIIIILTLCLFASQIGLAGEQIVLSPQEGHSNQNRINEAIKQAASSAKGASVFLTEGVYQVDNTIIMKSNVRLLGDSNAIIRVWGGSSQWFTGRIGVISCKESLKNVEIAGFQIDGNIGNLPAKFANSQPGREHDCEKLINIGGYSGDFANNIKIHDMKLYNAFSDGIYIIYAQNVEIYNNFISNCQHEGIYFSVVRGGGHIHNNRIAGITSDCARLDNCKNCLIEYNLFFSYSGNSHGAYKHGENGLQIGDAGSSKGYTAAKKGYPTEDIEVRFNTFSDPGLRAIWLHGGENVYIHDNEFIDATELETMGVPIGDISVDNPPSLELSEKVFSSIFDILDVEFTESGRTGQAADDFPLQVVEKESGIIAGGVKIIGFKDKIVLDNVSYIPGKDAILIQSKVIRNPNLNIGAVINDFNKDISIDLNNGTAYATMNVETTWYTVKRDSVTGKNKKSKIKTTEATFEDSYTPVPEILERDNTCKALVNVYSDTKNPISKLKVNHTNTTQRIEVFYNGNSTACTFLIGERLTDKAGIQYTHFSRCEMWSGSIPHMGNEIILIGKFDPSKLSIKCYTPYESFDVEKIEVKYHKTKEVNYNMLLLKWIIQIIMGMYAGYKIMDIAIN